MNALSCFLSPAPQSYPEFGSFLITPSSRRNTVPHILASSSVLHPKNQVESLPKCLKNSGKMASFPANLFNAIDGFINRHFDPPVQQPSGDPKLAFSGNTAPVDEHPPTECLVVEGSLPSCLDGAYIRNGPNPQFLPRGSYHLYDGDGMLHSIKISQGRATFCSRFVKTHKYVSEKDAGSQLIPSFFPSCQGFIASAAGFTLMVARIVTGQINLENGIGNANTSLSLFGGNLYAMVESDLPYALKLTPDGDIITLGRHDFSGMLKTNMTAHPKIDPETGEVFAFRYGAMPPFLTFFRISPTGTKEPDVKIFSMRTPALLHDFGITKSYAIFPDTQILINPLNIIMGKPPIDSDMKKVPRIGVIPRYAKDESEMKWFDAPGLNFLHTTNAWEEDEGNTIVIVAANILSIEHFLERMYSIEAAMVKVRINVKTGLVESHLISERSLELAVINPAYVGKENRYVYATIVGPGQNLSGVVKLDVSMSNGDDYRDCIVASRMYGASCYGGEPFFVAKNPNDPNADEDDGYVLCYVHDENDGESRFLVMDARSPTLEIVAAVKLPQRVPNGFHGLFVRESDITKL